MKNILYIYTDGRKKRLIKHKSKYPREMFYGYTEFRKDNYNVDIFERNKVIMKKSRWLQILDKIKKYFSVNELFDFNSVIFKPYISIFNKYDFIITVPDSIALSLSNFIIKRMIKCKVIYIAMGYASRLNDLKIKSPEIFARKKGKIIKVLECFYKIICIGSGEYDFYKREFPKLIDIFEFIPFGIDNIFWRSAGKKRKDRYILFIGNDINKDYEFLIKLTDAMIVCQFVFITNKMNNKVVPKNVRIINGDWRDEILSDNEIRDYYNNSSIVILPLKESLQPSGQSVALQAMSCGIPVLITKTKGFWDNENFIDNENIIFVEKNDIDLWVEKISYILNNRDIYKHISKESSEVIRKIYNCDYFYKKLKKFIESENE